MTPERWALLEPLLNQALDLPADQLTSWLVDLRATHPELARDLERLLEAESGPAAAWVDQDPGRVLPTASAGLVGQVFGNYRIEAAIGRGGMGSVWLASRNDGRYEGKVALKLLNLALVGRAGEERFHQEGNILARLTHPNIARLLDAGVTEAGQPFLVLEYVEGEQIDQYADHRGLDATARIRLVISVAEAVAAAHANLIVHRDIKPSNVMVTKDGSVKLLDFGIGKLLQEGRTTDTTFTDGGAMTPEYAAPELVMNERVSTATDVYSLAVLLYQLLSGRHPTNEGVQGLTDQLRAIVEKDPKPLSAVTGRRRDLRADLDLILARALKKDPVERYLTVADFAADLERYLSFHPIAARPDSFMYRTQRFVRRHRGSLLAAAIVVAALVASTVISLRQLRIAERQRDLARQSASRADASSSFATMLFRVLEGDSNQTFTVNELFTRARAAVETGFRDNPNAQLQLLAQFGQNYMRKGDVNGAAEVFQRGLEIADSLGEMEWQGRALCNRALPLREQGKADSSLALARRGMAMVEQSVEPARGSRMACYEAAGHAFNVLGKHDSAAALYDRNLALLVADGDTLGDIYMIALGDRARASVGAGRYHEAAPLLEKLLRLVRDDRNADPSFPRIIVSNTEFTLDAAGEHRQHHAFMAREFRLLYGEHGLDTMPPYQTHRYGLGFAALDQRDSARKYLARVVAMGQPLPPRFMVQIHATLAMIARHDAEAKQHLDAITRIRSEDKSVPRGQLSFHVISHASGSPAEVTALVQAELDSVGYGKAPNRTLVRLLVASAQALNRAGDYTGARAYASAAIEGAMSDPESPRYNSRYGAALAARADAELGLGDTVTARRTLRDAMPSLQWGLGDTHPTTAATAAKLASLK